MRRSEGFSLLEVLIAVAIVGGLMVAIIDMVNYHLSVMDRYQTLSVATMLGREKLHELAALPKQEKGIFPKPYQQYSYETTIVNGPLPFLNELDMKVWKGRDVSRLKIFVNKAGSGALAGPLAGQ